MILSGLSIQEQQGPTAFNMTTGAIDYVKSAEKDRHFLLLGDAICGMGLQAVPVEILGA
jgi:hypothetical protein